MTPATVREAPQELQLTKYNRLIESRVSVVSGDRHIAHVTYSLMYFFSRDSIFFGTYFPFITNRMLPSMDPVVPSSARKNDRTCSGWRFILRENLKKVRHGAGLA